MINRTYFTSGALLAILSSEKLRNLGANGLPFGTVPPGRLNGTTRDWVIDHVNVVSNLSLKCTGIGTIVGRGTEKFDGMAKLD